MFGDNEFVQKVLNNYHGAPLNEKEKLLFQYIELLCVDATLVDQRTIDKLKEAGWTEEQIYFAASVCALFHFYNVLADGLGVLPVTPEEYEQTAERLATQGYMPPKA